MLKLKKVKLLFSLIFLASIYQTEAVNITVSNLNNTGLGSLRQAITDINSSTDPTNTINFSVTGTINLVANLPVITKDNVTINGNNNIVINANAGNNTPGHIFRLQANSITIQNFELKNIGHVVFRIVGNLDNIILENINISNDNGNQIDHIIYADNSVSNVTIRNFDVHNQQASRNAVTFNQNITNLIVSDSHFRMGGGNGRAFQFTGIANNINISNTTIDCDANATNDDSDYGLFFNNVVSNVNIDNLNIHDAELRSIYAQNTVTNFEIRNSIFDNFDGHTTYEGIRFNSVVNNLTINDLAINMDHSGTEDDGNQGIYFNSNLITADIKYLNISNADQNAVLTNGVLQDVTVDSSTFSLNEKGLDILTTNTKTNVVVKNSTFANNSRLGLQFNSQNATTQVRIENNTFYGSSLATEGNAIRIVSGAITNQNGIEILKNTIYNNVGDGIYIERNNGVHISQNKIFGNKSGINLLNASNYDYTYNKANTPSLVMSESLGGNNYSVTFNVPSFCTDCDVEFFRNDSIDSKYQGREYLNTVSNLSAANNPHTVTLTTTNPTDFWTSKLIDNSKDQSTSEYSFHLNTSPFGPGGVSSSMQLWMSADKEMTVNSNNEIQTWENRQAVNPYLTKNGTPLLLTASEDLLNYNPVTFFGANANFNWGTNSFMTNKQAGEVFVVGKSASPTSTRHFYDFGGASAAHFTWNNNKIYEDFGSTERKVWNPTTLNGYEEGTTGLPAISSNVPPVIPFNYNIYNTSSQQNDWRANFNGFNHITDNTNNVNFTGTHVLGTSSGTSNHHLAEVILFDRVLQDYERARVTSYLAIKYGQTIGHNYVASNWDGTSGTTIWELGNGFDHGITAIGRDDNSSLYQKQSSSSQNNTIFSVSNGPFGQSNQLNTSTFQGDLDFLAIGNNGGSTSIQNNDIPTSGSADFRLVRLWRASEIGTNNTNYSLSFKEVPGSAYEYELYIDNDGNATFDPSTATTITGGIWENGQLVFNGIDLNNDDLFTIGYKLRSPGGINGKNTNGLAYTLFDKGTLEPTNGIPLGEIIGKGYLSNLSHPDNLILQEQTDLFTLLIEGELEIDAGAEGSYTFSAPSVDDNVAFWIDGNLVLSRTSSNPANIPGSITLSSGRHDLKLIFSDLGGAELLNIQYTLPGSSSAIAIPDDKLFTTSRLGLWLDASSQLMSESNEVTTWTDKSVSINKFSKATGNPLFLDGSEESSMNNNPSVELSGDEISGPEFSNGMVIQNQSRTLYTIIKTKASGAIVPFSTGRNTNSNHFGIRMENYQPNLMGFNNDVLATGNTVGINTTSMISGIYENSNINPTNNAKVFIDGLEVLAQNKTNWLTHLSPTEDFNVGGLVNGGNQFFTGSIAEVLLYPWNLNLAERTKVETYLAIKYGLSLDQTVQKHYTASDGSLIWDMNANPTYNNSITAIGRDDKSGLYQKQSRSSDANNKLKIGLGSYSASNTLNPNTFTTDLDFLTWGHNNGSTNIQNTNLPTASNAEFRYGRTWKVVEKGTDHTNYTIVFEDIPGSAFDYELMIDTDGDDDFTTGNPTIITNGTWTEGTLTFNNVDLNSGNTITVGFNLGAPGGLTFVNTNGIHYKLYDEYTENPSTQLNGNLISEGYVNNLENLHLIIQNLKPTQYTFELETNLQIDVTEDYTFTASSVSDRLAIWINNDLEITQLTGSSNLASTKTLVAGNHNLRIRLGNNTGGGSVTLQYASPTISPAINLPDEKLFVDANISLWYTAGSLVSNTGHETDVTTWKDFSINQNNVTNLSGTPTYFDGSESDNLMNFNPSVDFQNEKMFGENFTFGLPFGKQSRTLFTVATTSDNSENASFTSGLNSNSNLYGLSIGNYRPGVFGFNTDVFDASYFITPNKAAIISGIHENFKITPTLNGSLYHNGRHVTSSNQNLTTRFNEAANITIGGATDASNRNYNGQIGEILYFPWKLNDTDIDKVETYLSIKYGITKDQSTPTHYLASDGSVIWNSTTFSDYKTNIAGIGFDEKSILNQKQSKSVNAGAMLTIGLGSIESTNALNTTSFSMDKSFLIWGSNGERNVSQTLDNPSANVDYRLAREWKVSEINNENNYTLQFNLLPFSSYEHELFIDTDGDGNFSTGSPTIITGGTMVDGVLKFNNVDLQHGDVFTVGFNRFAPGGVVGENTNGIHYALYNGYSPDTRTDLNGDLLSEGYIDNLQNVSNFFTTEITTNFTLELDCELDITETGNHTFEFTGIDAGAALWIDDVLYIHREPSSSNLTHTANLTVGKHKFKLRFTNEAGGNSLTLRYTTPSNATLSQISDDKFFVNTEIGSWFSADAQVSQTGTSTTVDAWMDLSANQNNVTTTEGTPLFSRGSEQTNFNPFVSFNNVRMEGEDYSNGMAFASQNRTVYTVFSTEATNTGTIVSHGNDQNNILFGVEINNLKPRLSGWNTVTESATATVQTNKLTLVSGIFENPILTPTNNSHIFQNGELLNSQTRGWFTRFNDSEDFNLGKVMDRSDRNFDGNIAEVIYFPWKLSENDQTKVESYIALKYGMTLNQNIVQNYLASNNSILWNSTSNSAFGSNIIGIGRDDKSGFNQKQSRSIEIGNELTLALGNIEATNQLNNNIFSNNISYLVCGNNGEKGLQNSGLPSSSSAEYRMKKVWKVNKTGVVPTVTLQFDNIPAVAYNIGLFIDTDNDGDFTNATVIPGTLVDGKLTFTGVNLNTSDQFTVGYSAYSPGGVLSGMSLWLKADVGLKGTLVKNGGFSSGYDNWLHSGNQVVSNGEVHFNSGNSTPNGILYQNIETNVGEEYTFSYRTAGHNSNSMLLQIEVIDSTTNDVIYSTVSGRSNYGVNTVQVTPSGNVTQIKITDVSTGTVSVDIRIDDIVFFNNNVISTIDKPAVAEWENQISSSKRATQSLVNEFSSLNTSSRNYNPGVTFDGNDHYKLYESLIDDGNTDYTIVSVQTPTATKEAQIVFLGTETSKSGVYHQIDGSNIFESSWPGSGFTGGTVVQNNPDIYLSRYSNTTGRTIRQDGTQVGNNNDITFDYKAANNLSLLGRHTTTGNRGFQGDINEVIVYNDNALSNEELTRVESYLAIKYGITLPNNYYASDWNGTTGTSLWTIGSGFDHDIAAIGRDDQAQLNQKQSKSVHTDDIIAMGLDSVYTTNQENTNTFSNDKSFLAWGNNNSGTAAVNLGIPSLFAEKTARTWKSVETSTVDSVLIQITDTEMQAIGFTPNAQINLFIADDENFSTNIIQIPLVKVGDNWQAKVDFVGTQYFSFGVEGNASNIHYMRHGKHFENGVKQPMKF